MKQKYEKLHTFLDRKYTLWIIFAASILVGVLIMLSGVSNAGGFFWFAAAFCVIAKLSHKEFFFRWNPMRALFREQGKLDEYRRLMVNIALIFLGLATVRLVIDLAVTVVSFLA